MFQGIVAEHGRCAQCQKVRWVAAIPEGPGDKPWGTLWPDEPLKLCAGCIYKLTRLAGLLLKLEAVPKVKAKKAPQKPRKPRISQPGPNAGPLVGLEHEPVLSDQELADREL